jgi:putative Mg2+ transporter-C (MgtC) family protein
MFEFNLSLEVLAQLLFQLGIAFILSLPIALNREMKKHGAGLRTFPLVSIASCAFMLVGIDIYHESDSKLYLFYVLY